MSGCPGRCEIVVNVPVVLVCKRIPRGPDGSERLLTSRARNNGVRVAADTIRRLVDTGKFDVVCSTCGWSLKRACALKGRK